MDDHVAAAPLAVQNRAVRNRAVRSRAVPDVAVPGGTAPHVPGLHLARRLGRGAHGEVWAAVDLGTGEQVAVKVRPAGTCAARSPRPGPDDAERARSLVRETTLLRRLDHPHVVRLRRVLDLPDGSRALVLDLAAGGSLGGLVAARGPLAPPEVTTLVIGLARALAELHAAGVVHADLSPGNVLFTANGRPLLSDLGLAALLGVDRDRPGWGTPGFVDPAGGPAGDPARDVWGLAAVAWFALTGAPPPSRTRSGRATGPGHQELPEPLRREALALFLLRCLDVRSARRPAVVDVARLAWQSGPPAPIRLVSSVVSPSPVVPPPSAAAPAPAGAPVPDPSAGGPGAVPETAPGPRRPCPDPAGSLGGPDDDLADAAFLLVTQPIRATGPALPQAGPGRRVRRWPLHRGRNGPERRWLRVVVPSTAAIGLALVTAGAIVATRPSTAPALSLPSFPPRPSVPHPGPLPSPDCRAEDPPAGELTRAVCELARQRAAALASASTHPLSAVDVPGSPALAADTALVGRLAAGGRRLQGIGFSVSGLRVLDRSPGGVTVAVAVVTGPYRQVRADGTVEREIPAGAPRQVVLDLAGRSTGGWLVRSARAA